MTEDWPVRPAAHLFYAQEKAEIERLLAAEAAGASRARPLPAAPADRPRARTRSAPRSCCPGRSRRSAAASAGSSRRLPVPLPALAPTLPVQFIHEDDVGQAFLLCIVGAGPPGAYNITGDGVVTGAERRARARPRRAAGPGGGHARRRARAGAPAAAALRPAAAEWVEAASQPAIMDASKAKRELGWRPRYTSLEALRDTIADR